MSWFQNSKNDHLHKQTIYDLLNDLSSTRKEVYTEIQWFKELDKLKNNNNNNNNKNYGNENACYNVPAYKKTIHLRSFLL